ncbi:hypothetical protein C9F11_37670 [Streptomyces sp. YIM 121038]|uniref:hypothetical protein n=1 Tax=Streptomyces sp. YIM 121038 TaxID=2136401 RepID=UPI001110296D|nr:hypothetical protein [Streptomyces sp. YIM 121038]QCX81117.1 hypothetical protein C9F11_37670 [Streptomyces sp. YIM 121038]
MIAETVPAAVALATSAYATASIPVLLLVDDPVWPSRRELIETRAGDRLLVEIARARHTAAGARTRAALSGAALLLLLSAPKGISS